MLFFLYIGHPVYLCNFHITCSFLPTENERNSLPGFPRERLRLCYLLGSGAFGEVYEGIALDILGKGSGETKVAVKVNKCNLNYLSICNLVERNVIIIELLCYDRLLLTGGCDHCSKTYSMSISLANRACFCHGRGLLRQEM